MRQGASAKRQLIVNTSSSSGGSVAVFKKPGRAIITATKSGTEKNATACLRCYWVAALRDAATDHGQERCDQRNGGVPIS